MYKDLCASEQKWQALPLFWQCSPLLWQGLPLFMQSLGKIVNRHRENLREGRAFRKCVFGYSCAERKKRVSSYYLLSNTL